MLPARYDDENWAKYYFYAVISKSVFHVGVCNPTPDTMLCYVGLNHNNDFGGTK